MRRLASRLLAAAICLAAATFAAAPAGADAPCRNDDGCVRVLRVSGLIDPIIIEFVEHEVDAVRPGSGYVATVLELDSDGSAVDDAELTRFVRHLRAAPIPVSAWVGTSAAAKGAAAELVAALPHSAMAALSQIGDIDRLHLPSEVVGEKSAALAKLRGRTISAGRAKDLGIVAAAVPTFPQYVATLDGVSTSPSKGSEGDSSKQATSGGSELNTSVVFSKPDLWPQALHTIASPAVTYLLLGLGIGLLLFEFFTAGVGIAGVVGAAAALGAGYGLGVLPVRSWALALLLVTMPAFAIDIQAGIQRFWTFAGLVAWIVGSFFLFDGVTLPWPALATGVIGMAVAMLSGMPAMVRSRFGTPTIDRGGLVGALGTTRATLDGEGLAVVDGALWRVRSVSSTLIQAGSAIRVVSVDGLMLEVEAADDTPVDADPVTTAGTEPER